MKSMKKKSVFSLVIHWVQSTEMFERPFKQLPGKWKLFEYYTEPHGDLIHVQEDLLQENQLFWEIEFSCDGKATQQSNIPFSFLSETNNYLWNHRKNYIIFVHSRDFRNNVTFQFAIDKGKLKLLKKSISGKIEVFGFFRKIID